MPSAIARRIEETAQGALGVNRDPIYAALQRLERKGWITSQSETSERNHRTRFYAIARAGREQLAVQTDRRTRTVEAMTRVLEPEPADFT